jgi:hypothetical protein
MNLPDLLEFVNEAHEQMNQKSSSSWRMICAQSESLFSPRPR